MNKNKSIVDRCLIEASILLEDNNTNTINNRRQQYDDYLTNHISGVKKAYEQIFQPILDTESDLTVEEISNLENNIDHHDASKYSDEEYIPYLDHFYPENGKKKVHGERARFDKACLHHYHHNPHHWNHWILNDDEDKDHNRVLDMDEIYVIEMICDWHSFSIKNPDSTAYNWWNKNRNKMDMSDNTIKLVEKWIQYAKEPIK